MKLSSYTLGRKPGKDVASETSPEKRSGSYVKPKLARLGNMSKVTKKSGPPVDAMHGTESELGSG